MKLAGTGPILNWDLVGTSPRLRLEFYKSFTHSSRISPLLCGEYKCLQYSLSSYASLFLDFPSFDYKIPADIMYLRMYIN